jgi:hypothetical protein
MEFGARSDPRIMSISRLSLSGSAYAGLSSAVDAQSRGLERFQASFADEPAHDHVVLSTDARQRLEQPEEIVADTISAEAAVHSAAAVTRAEEERFAALLFVVSHHGPGLR